MICLGIESTAHTFGASVAERSGNSDQDFHILSDSKDVYKAPEGSGIHPREASRHHVEACSSVVERALADAKTKIEDLDFIAYSAGPGLGPCLRVGAVVARSLASYFNKPLVPTNHAIGHIELGRLLVGQSDPLVLLISGGHTAIVARSSEGWRVFGETLDLTLGQLLDQLGRHFGLSSPAGQKIESFASSFDSVNQEFPLLPYAIKGNDVSYSGLLSAAKDLYSKGMPKETISYAVQEISFALLTEATERALAFTDKSELLVTGGVAANQRLCSMLDNMCQTRGVKIGIIPRQYAGDCGSQIAAAGFLFYSHDLAMPPSKAFTRQSWRLDTVNVSEDRIKQNRDQIGTSLESVKYILGAEARVEIAEWQEIKAIRKIRHPKNYRNQRLDSNLRTARTKEELEILYNAKLAGVDCPEVFFADPTSSEILMEYVTGQLLKDIPLKEMKLRKTVFRKLGISASRMHRRGIIHGDLTTKNVIISGQRLVIIDFGLSFISDRLEDRAEDLHLLKQALKSSSSLSRATADFENVLEGYQSESGLRETEQLRSQIRKIELRGRYARVD